MKTTDSNKQNKEKDNKNSDLKHADPKSVKDVKRTAIKKSPAK